MKKFGRAIQVAIIKERLVICIAFSTFYITKISLLFSARGAIITCSQRNPEQVKAALQLHSTTSS
jgi:hypothetical protein